MVYLLLTVVTVNVWGSTGDILWCFLAETRMRVPCRHCAFFLWIVSVFMRQEVHVNPVPQHMTMKLYERQDILHLNIVQNIYNFRLTWEYQCRDWPLCSKQHRRILCTSASSGEQSVVHNITSDSVTQDPQNVRCSFLIKPQIWCIIIWIHLIIAVATNLQKRKAIQKVSDWNTCINWTQIGSVISLKGIRIL